jgi:ubiquinone/menaquinone biosynthesis C-methylase UbiE
MTSQGYVHGRTDEREVARLEKQAEWTATFTFHHIPAKPGERLLDLATGVGAMGVRLQRDFPGTWVVGVDLSATQLGAARANHPGLPLLRGDATRLPFADATFDRVHASWLLEHVPDPLAVLREVRRVLKPGGTCHFIEVNNATFSVTPAFPEVAQVMAALNAAQVAAGGDPFVGQRLHELFAAAGFSRFTVTPNLLHGTQGDPKFLASFIDEFAEIFDGLDESLGAQLGGLLATAAAQLRSLQHHPDAELRYTAAIAQGVR